MASAIMRAAAMTQPSQVRLRAVRAGDEISVAVEGGFVRRRAPGDGVVIELDDRDLYLPVEALVDALRALGFDPQRSVGPR